MSLHCSKCKREIRLTRVYNIPQGGVYSMLTGTRGTVELWNYRPYLEESVPRLAIGHWGTGSKWMELDSTKYSAVMVIRVRIGEQTTHLLRIIILYGDV